MSIRRYLNGKTVWKAAAIGVLGFGLYYGAVRPTILHKASAQVKAVPFTAELHTYTFSKQASGELLTKKIVARRADGATATIQSAGPIETGWNSRKLQYMDGRYTGVVDLISTVLRGSTGSAGLAALKARLTNPPPNCVVDVSFRLTGYERIYGRSLAKIVREHPDNVYTMWFDPELGCEMLQTVVEMKQPDGSLKLLSRTLIVGLHLGEPDQRLFDEPPVSYQEALSVKELEQRFGAAVQQRFPSAPAE